MDPKVLERVESWLSGPYDESVKSEIRRLLSEKPVELTDAFYRDLSFGTGGMRGIMGIGTNRMNIYTVRAATQGLADYLLKQASERSHRVFIGYDVRMNSRLFAEEAARVLAGNGIPSLITEDICPTPLASFGCREYRCSAAIMITASHNPPQYNGYKVFWSDGAQVVLPHDEEIMAHVRRVLSPVQVFIASLQNPLIHWIGSDIDEAYLKRLDEARLSPQRQESSVQLIYTNLHGTGMRLVPKALNRWGFNRLTFVEAQKPYDGHFSAAPSPNPEEEKALSLGTEQLMKEKADLLLATDPDADRLGVVVRGSTKPERLNGNQIACICLDHIASILQGQNRLPKKASYIKTIVTSELTRKIAQHFGIQCFDVLTGFKYIAELIRLWEENDQNEFLFGAEESHGYLVGTFVRDKDSISAACILSEAAERAKQQNRTLLDHLNDLYKKFGVHRQSLTTLAFADSPQGMEKMQSLMSALRKSPPTSIAGKLVACREDYLEKVSIDCKTKNTQPIALPVSDVLRFWLDDESKLVIRPSGTEPKVKIYAEVCDKPSSNLQESLKACDQRLKDLVDDFKKLVV
jgi:phosphomannomutase